MKNVLYKKNAIRKKCTMKRVQHEKGAVGRKCNMEKAKHKKSATKKKKMEHENSAKMNEVQ